MTVDSNLPRHGHAVAIPRRPDAQRCRRDEIVNPGAGGLIARLATRSSVRRTSGADALYLDETGAEVLQEHVAPIIITWTGSPRRTTVSNTMRPFMTGARQ